MIIMNMRKPEWLKTVQDREAKEAIREMNIMLKDLSLNTVCKEASCPNMGECFKKNTATFMIMGPNCTRHCKFCDVTKGEIFPLDPNEPENVALASKKLGLKHIVVTSVTRDDLEDGGAVHFAKTIRAIKRAIPDSTVEVLIPDLKGVKESLDIVIDAKPDVINHNVETVPSLYSTVRPGAIYSRSLNVLKYVKEKSPDILTKTGIMLGLGEEKEEVLKLMDDLVKIDCDIFTLGQYLRPSSKHIEVKEYVTPETFEEYKRIGEEKGIKYVASSPLVRSSYNALEAIKRIRGL
ncbi:lipoyl synthase [Proteiniborus sp. DW1]|uniref:lipoyl synthase n=1 Tax=Proteiniborus sp. DW1 TaxID=1889883 RepID=UPI00241C6C97|nr:lipoyl synthase [Proteiniborus sp. DW1]